MSRWLAGLVAVIGAVVVGALALLLAPQDSGDRTGPAAGPSDPEAAAAPDGGALRAPPARREEAPTGGSVTDRIDPGALEVVRPTRLEGLFGRVVDRQGLPIAGAMVFHGGISAIADAEGRFRLNGLPPRPTALVAAALGFQPARLGPDEARPGTALEVVIAGRALAITGIAVDREGKPWPGLRVEILDGMPCDDAPAPGKGPPAPPGLIAETLAGGTETALATGADGRFRVPGLSQRLYRLRFSGAGVAEPVEQRARAGEELRVEIAQAYPGVPNDGLARSVGLGKQSD